MSMVGISAPLGASLTINEIVSAVPAIGSGGPAPDRSDRYLPVSTVGLIERLAMRDIVPVAAKQTWRRGSGRSAYAPHIVRLRPRAETGARARRVGDTWPEIIIQNSHDGTSAFRLRAGLFRLACLNGLVVPDKSASEIKIPHWQSNAEVIEHMIDDAIDRGLWALGVADEWSQIVLSDSARASFAERAHAMRFLQRDGSITTPFTPADLLAVRRQDDRGSDLWSTLNVIQENILMGGISTVGTGRAGKPRKFTLRPIQAIDAWVDYNTGVWRIARDIAEEVG